MDEKLIQLATLLSEECDWPIDIDDLDSPLRGPFWNYSKEELGLPDDMDIELAGYQLIPPQGFEDKMRIYFLSIEGTGRLHVTRLRAILKELARKGRRVRAGEGGAIHVGVEDIIFVCSLLEPKNATRYFCHFQDKEDGKRPKLMIGPKWEDSQPEAEKERAVATLRNNLQWPDKGTSLDVWRDEWSNAFTVEHLYVPKTSKQLAKRLAVFAKQIRESIPEMHALENRKGPIRSLLKAFREALIKDLKLPDFADMVAQTITYGLFSARATGTELSGIETLAECIPLTNPFLRDLFSEFASLAGDKPTDLDFDDLSLGELVEMLNVCNIDAIMDDFGSQFKGGKEDPVIHFYETFLSEYDHQRRAERGVFYTPKPVVDFIVRSVHDRLIEDFGLPLGLADTSTHIVNGKEWPKVMIIDPATGTGTFLEVTIDIIHKTMLNHWISVGNSKSEIPALWNEYVDEHLLPRLYGFELMMAPYSIAHLKLGMKLIQTGYNSEVETRLNVYLTNTLQPPSKVSEWVPDFISEESSSADQVKLEKPFTVVLGNPPYSVISSNKFGAIEKLMEDYKTSIKERERQIQALSDDYVKFIRFSQYLIERTGFGIVGLITNRNYIGGHLFPDFRSFTINQFDKLIITDLNGNTRTGKITDDDENVFDIQTGVAVMIASSYLSNGQSCKEIKHSSLVGSAESKFKLLSSPKSIDYKTVSVRGGSAWKPNSESQPEWDNYPEFHRIWGTGSFKKDRQERYAAGMVSQQDQFAISFSSAETEQKFNLYIDPSTNESTLRSSFKMCSTKQWNYEETKLTLVNADFENVVTNLAYRPFDERWTVYNRGFVTILREKIMQNMRDSRNIALLTVRGTKGHQFRHAFVARGLIDRHAIDNASESMYVFPLYIVEGDQLSPNLPKYWYSEFEGSNDNERAYKSFCYIYAVLYSNSYRRRYTEQLLSDFPRIPLTENLELKSRLIELGELLCSLHLMEYNILDGETNVSFQEGTNGKVVGAMNKSKAYVNGEVFIDTAKLSGSKFTGITDDVWYFKIGGYQVCHKWLYDRRKIGENSGRTLSDNDIQHYIRIVTSIQHTLELMKQIDEVIEEHGGWPLEGSEEFGIPPEDWDPVQMGLGDF